MDVSVGFLCIDVHWRTRLRFRTIIDIMHPLMPGGCKLTINLLKKRKGAFSE